MAKKDCNPGRRRKNKASLDAEDGSVQGDLLERVEPGADGPPENSIDTADEVGAAEVIPVVFVGDLAELEGVEAVPAEDEAVPDVEEAPDFDAPIIDERLERALETAREGRLQEALRLYIEILSETPAYADAQFGLGTLYDDLGRPELAIERFLAASELDPHNARVRASLGAAYGAVGRFEDADIELKLALILDSRNVEVRVKEGLLAFRKGLYAAAEASLRGVCREDPRHVTAHFYRGEALNRLGRVREAVPIMERVIELQPHNWRAYHTLGMLFDRMHEPDRAREMHRRARELNV